LVACWRPALAWASLLEAVRALGSAMVVLLLQSKSTVRAGAPFLALACDHS
jgi:hypothetical protein